MRRARVAVACLALSLPACRPSDALLWLNLARPPATIPSLVPPPTTPPTTLPAEPTVTIPAETAMDETLEALAWCESTNTNDLSGPYAGYLQFSDDTWTSVTGLPGPASDYSREQQFQAAAKLVSESGYGSWPACADYLGLL